ncbi:Fe-S cluster assembly ATPase SufC [Candidatus Microgenomates bacterium]|nr:MAG: Fe-S cluster assembly ATPase SufC [Candidatus Microgenomates bacterium]
MNSLIIKNKTMLVIKNLHVFAEKIEILKGIDLTVKKGEAHVLMGPNGAGKTTFAMALMGQNKFKVQSSKFKVSEEDMDKLITEERARKGLFVSFQNPIEIEGLSSFSFLRNSYNSIFPNNRIPIKEFKEIIRKALKEVGLSEDFLQRAINQGSGGEKKRAEIAQLLVLKPSFVVLDEIDSGLDIDSLKILMKIIKNLVEEGKIGVIIITHNPGIFKYLDPNFVHILIDGKIKKTGTENLIKEIEEKGYAKI